MKRRVDQWEKMAAKRKSDHQDDQLTPGLDEEDPEAHTRPDKRSRSSHQPELPIADGDDDDNDEPEPPGLAEESDNDNDNNDDDDDATIDYRDDIDDDVADSNMAYLMQMERE